MGKYVLDACALIANLKKEEGWDVVEDIVYGKNEILLHSVNLLEIYYDMIKTFDETRARNTLDEILASPIRIIYNADLSLIKAAGYFKANYRISLGDSFVLAVAKLNLADIVTADRHEFSVVENKESGLNFHWIR